MTQVPSAEAALHFTVTDADTAAAVGPGACRCSAPRGCWRGARPRPAPRSTLPWRAGETSVGTRIQLEHLAPSAVGQDVEITARLAYADGRLRRFSVAARNVGPDGPAS